MKFRTIFRFEFTYQLRFFSTWLLFAVFLLFGFGILRLVSLTGDTYLNAPGTIAFFTVFGSAIWVVIGGVIAGDAGTRDRQARMHPLTYTTPGGKLQYLGARFLAALALNTLLLLALYAGMLLSFYAPGARTQFIGPFQPASYLTNFGFVALPAVIVTTAIQFMCAALSGRAIASYIASIILVIFSQFGGTTVRFLLEWKVLGSLMDLLGTSIVAEMEGWTPIEKNTRLVLLEGTWLWNRVMWFGIGAGALLVTYFKFQLTHLTPHNRRLGLFKRKPEVAPPAAENQLGTPLSRNLDTSPTKVPPVTREFGLATYVRQVTGIAEASFGAIANGWTGLTLVALLAIGTGLFATEYMQFFNVPLLARAEEVLRIFAPPLSSYQTQWIIIPLLSIFYAGELVWREREANLHELSDTSPVPEWVMFLGKFLGLALIIMTWMAFLLIGGIINQLVMEYHHFEIDVYGKALFGIQLTNYLLFALLVFVIQVLVNQKYLGLMVAFCAYGFILFSSMLGIEHNLLVYGSDTGWAYSDMSGFGPFITPWLWFKFYWASWALLLSVGAILFWVRNKETGLKTRFGLAQRRFAKHKLAIVISLGLVLVSGGFIFYNTNVLNTYTTKKYRMEMRAEYERRYGQYETIPQPALARTTLQVAIYPEDNAAEIKGSYQLVNRSKGAIDSIHLSTIPHLELTTISFDRPVTPVVLDEHLGYRIYSLKKGLAPGDSIQVSFTIQIEQRGFGNEGVDVSVVANGSHITSDWMPIIGYNDDRRLRTAKDRTAYGLAARPERPSLYDQAARYDAREAAPMDFEAVVSTSKGQIAVAPGALRRTWMKDDRQYFHYATTAPIHNSYAFFSARYAVREARWVPQVTHKGPDSAFSGQNPENTAKPVTIQIFYHPGHDGNVERMVKSAQASLGYYAQEFGPYPYSHFRVLERAGPGRGMHAEPMTIDFPSGYSLMNPAPGGLDLPYHIMAHEVAHQWWGYYLSPASVEGAGLLVESLATYSAMQVVEETLGYEHLRMYLSQMRQEYEVPRSRSAPPLLRANSRFMNYRQGPFALFALRNYLGKDKVNHALRQLLKNYSPSPPLPTTLDFYRELQAVTPDSLQYLVHDLFAANTYWALETKEAITEKTEAGTWQVILQVEARKVVLDETGVETERPMHDWVEIGVYAPWQKGAKSGKQLYLQKHRIKPGKQTITVTVSETPSRAGIDPNHLLLDLELENNTKLVQRKGMVKETPSII